MFISLLWPMSVMMDGDWYACYYTDKKLNCRESNLTADGQRIMKDLKNESRIIGFGVLLGIVLLAGILWPIPWRKCCCWFASKECCPCCQSSKYYSCCCLNKCCICCKSDCVKNNVLFEKIVLEEDENVVTDKLIEAAKGKMNEKLDKYVAEEKWRECYYVVDEIIENLQHRYEDKETQTCDELVTVNIEGESSDGQTEQTGQSLSVGSRSTFTSKGNEHVAAGKREKGSAVEKEHMVQSLELQSTREKYHRVVEELIDQSPSHRSPSESSLNDDVVAESIDQPPSQELTSESSSNYDTTSF